MRVLVTGGAGFIGSHVVDRLLADGHEVSVVDNLSAGRAEFVKAEAVLHRCDIRSARLEDVFATARPAAVVHLAAQAAVARGLEHGDARGAVNVGSGVETSVNEIYERLTRATGANRLASHAPAKPGEQRRSVLDPTRAKRLLGWTSSTPLDAGLERTVAAFRAELGLSPPEEDARD